MLVGAGMGGGASEHFKYNLTFELIDILILLHALLSTLDESHTLLVILNNEQNQWLSACRRC